VVREAIQLAVRHVAHLLPQTVGTVVQDDLHNLSICGPGRTGCRVSGPRACIPEAAGRAT
jgi:hypothetical protein